MFVDPLGMEAERGGLGPTALEAAYMAKHIYSPYDEKNILIGGWSLYDIPVDEHGFRIGIYTRMTNGVAEFVVVNKGSTTLLDWGNNFQQPFGDSADMEQSINFALEFVKDHPNAHITFAGHSKGGAEALGNAVATNRNAIVFNPAPINLDKYSFGYVTYDAHMDIYVVEGEILDAVFGDMFDQLDVHYLNPPSEVQQFKINIGHTDLSLEERIKNHSMDTVIKALS